MIHVVVPTGYSPALGFYQSVLESYSSFDKVRIIWVLEPDAELPLPASKQVKIIYFKAKNRISRINKALETIDSGYVLLNHPRSILEKSGIEKLFKTIQQQPSIWGGFTHQFDVSHPVLKFTSWYSNKIRFDLSGIIYLDHCIFFPRNFLNDYEYFEDLDIFEDTALSKKLLKHQKPKRIQSISKTSAVRFEKNGIIYQSLMNQILKIAYHLRAPRTFINRIYEKGLWLN